MIRDKSALSLERTYTRTMTIRFSSKKKKMIKSLERIHAKTN